jgi:hypothetical protein
MEVTPIGKSGFLSYRIAVTSLAGALLALFAVRLAFPTQDWGLSLVVAILVGTEAVAVAFVLLGLASNKVEGLAIAKLVNIGSFVPVLAGLPFAWRHAFGLVPSFWIGEMLGLNPAPIPFALALCLAVLTHLLAIWLFFWLAMRRSG